MRICFCNSYHNSKHSHWVRMGFWNPYHSFRLSAFVFATPITVSPPGGWGLLLEAGSVWVFATPIIVSGSQHLFLQPLSQFLLLEVGSGYVFVSPITVSGSQRSFLQPLSQFLLLEAGSGCVFVTPITVSGSQLPFLQPLSQFLLLGATEPWNWNPNTMFFNKIINVFYINILKILCLGFSFGCSALLKCQKRDRGQQNQSWDSKNVIGVSVFDVRPCWVVKNVIGVNKITAEIAKLW